MDELRFNVPFNSISFLSGRWKGEHEKLYAMQCRLSAEIILPPAGLEPETPWSEVGSATTRPRGRFYSRARIYLSECPLYGVETVYIDR